MWKQLRDAGSIDELDLGSDHKTVRAKFHMTINKKADTRHKQKLKRQRAPPWKSCSTTLFLKHLEAQLDDVKLAADLEERCERVERALTESAQLAKQAQATRSISSDRNKLNDMVIERKHIPHSETAARAAISKKIQKELKHIRRIEHTTKISKILEDFKGLKRISGIKTIKKKELITHATDKNGEAQSRRQTIADVFATFYEELFKSRQKEYRHPREFLFASRKMNKFSRSQRKSSQKKLHF